MLCALIMAGGKGTRFYPLSTDEKPKQFLSLLNEKTMIQMTIERLKTIIPIEQIYVATGKKYYDITKEQLPDLPEKNIIIEPVGRNTAPCVVMGALKIQKDHPHANLAVLPSDALIKDVEEFVKVIKAADEFLKMHKQSVITIGIEVDRIETGYGYIKKTQEYEMVDGYKINKVEKFVEKPNYDLARTYYESGDYLWNAGMFIWNVDYVEYLANIYMKDTYDKLKQIIECPLHIYEERLFDLYPQVESISIDYAIMEKIDSIYVIPGEFGWDDVGSWLALERYLNKDDNNNLIKGDCYLEDSKGNIIFSTNKKIVLLDVDNLFAIEADEMIVIGNKEKLSKIHELRTKELK